MVTQAESYELALSWSDVPYAMANAETGETGDYREDCSGYVSMCWKIPPPGADTVSLVTRGLMYEIPWAVVSRGDAVGICGRGTLGSNGHIMYVVSYDHESGMLEVLEQTPDIGPQHNFYNARRLSSAYKPYRCYQMEDLPHMITDDDIRRIQGTPYVDAERGFPNPYRFGPAEIDMGTNAFVVQLLGMVSGIVETLKTIDGIDPAAVEAAVEKGIADAVAKIRVTVEG